MTYDERLCDHRLEAPGALVELDLSDGVVDQVAVVAVIRIRTACRRGIVMGK